MSENPIKSSTNTPVPGENTSQFSTQTVFIALRMWWKIATPLGILLAIGAAAGMYFSYKPEYTAATWLLIRDRPPILLKQEGRTDTKQFVENQIEMLKSPTVIDQVASIPSVANTPEIVRLGLGPVQGLRKLLKIRALGKSDYFVIEFTSIDREKAALIVNKIAETYLEFQRAEINKVEMLTIGLLEKEQAAQQILVERHRTNVRDLTKQLTGSEAFPLGPNQSRLEIRTASSEIQSKLVAAEVEQVLLKAQIEAEKEVLATQTPEPLNAEIDRQVEESEPVRALLAKIEAGKARLREHEKVSANFEQNAIYQRLKGEIQADEQELEKKRAEFRAIVQTHLEKSIRTQREDQVATMQQRLASADFTVQLLREKLDQENAGRQAEKGESLELEFVRGDYQRAADVHEAIANRILHMRMEQRAPGQVTQAEVAKPPTHPDGTLPYKKVAFVALGALLLPFAGAVAWEQLHRRVSTREQLEKGSGLMVVGEVTTLPRRTRARKKDGVFAPNRERQIFEESIDGLRTYLTLVHSLQGLKVLAVTSAVSREGKTTLAAQLAISLANATGERTLLIDGDTRSPDVHRAFDTDRGPGLVDVLQGTIALEDAIETEFSDSLHVLTAGCLESNPHRLLGLNGFGLLLDKLKESYRYVVIDTPPILPASESLLIAQAADAAVLCVRRDYSRLDQTTEAYGRLRSAGVTVAGAVLNGIPSAGYIYRYGSYYQDRQLIEGAVAAQVAN